MATSLNWGGPDGQYHDPFSVEPPSDTPGTATNLQTSATGKKSLSPSDILSSLLEPTPATLYASPWTTRYITETYFVTVPEPSGFIPPATTLATQLSTNSGEVVTKIMVTVTVSVTQSASLTMMPTSTSSAAVAKISPHDGWASWGFSKKAGVIVGSIGGFAVVALLLWCLCRRKRRRGLQGYATTSSFDTDFSRVEDGTHTTSEDTNSNSPQAQGVYMQKRPPQQPLSGGIWKVSDDGNRGGHVLSPIPEADSHSDAVSSVSNLSGSNSQHIQFMGDNRSPSFQSYHDTDSDISAPSVSAQPPSRSLPVPPVRSQVQDRGSGYEPVHTDITDSPYYDIDAAGAEYMANTPIPLMPYRDSTNKKQESRTSIKEPVDGFPVQALFPEMAPGVPYNTRFHEHFTPSNVSSVDTSSIFNENVAPRRKKRYTMQGAIPTGVDIGSLKPEGTGEERRRTSGPVRESLARESGNVQPGESSSSAGRGLGRVGTIRAVYEEKSDTDRTSTGSVSGIARI